MNRLDHLIREVFEDEAGTLGDDTPFAAAGGWDSLKHVHLVVGVESRFGVELTADEVAHLTSKAAVRRVLMDRAVWP